MAVLSGNRNFEGRINSDVRANYLASPPLVVAYAIAGTMDIDLTNDPIGHDPDGSRTSSSRRSGPPRPRSPTPSLKSVRAEMFHKEYGDVFKGDERWNSLPVPKGDLYEWDDSSTYVKNPPYFIGMPAQPPPVEEIRAPGPSPCWAIASRPTTSRPPGRSRSRGRRAAT